MGILNVTPDSFSDGGAFLDPEKAYGRALQMEEEGADVIDIGGESTRPGALPVSVDEEIKRLRPVLQKISGKIKVPLSVDTRHAAVARMAIEEGVSWVNDVSALSDPEMVSVVSHYQVKIVLMHMKGTPQTMQDHPQYQDVVYEVFDELQNKIELARASMVKMDNIIVDPGIGFGKSLEDNLKIFKNLETFQKLNCPVLIGFSRKRVVKALFGETSEMIKMGNLSMSLLAIQKGVQFLRVHDVAETKILVNVLGKMGDI